jgi:hypothetical protein
MVLFYHWLGGLWNLLGIVPGVLVALPVDKMLDDRYRRLKPIEKDDHAA